MTKADGKYRADDMTYIAEKLAESDVPFIIKGTKVFKDLTAENCNPDRRINFIDSSIWLRYANDDETENQVKSEYERYYNLGLYSTSRAKENREFNSRVFKNSYLKNFDGTGHGGAVAPFVFHSETEMKYKYTAVLEKLLKFGQNKTIEWRVLIVDDHATEKTAEKECNNGKKVVSKCKILQAWFEDLKFSVCCKGCMEEGKKRCPNLSQGNNITSNFTVALECAETIEDARKALQTKKYDLILFDYLLKKKQEKKYAYAYQLLNEMKEVFDDEHNIDIRNEWLTDLQKDENVRVKLLSNPKNYVKQRMGSGGRFTCLFMSAFVNAVQNRMLQLGLLPHTNYWNLGRGACPTTTPNLFKYYLTQTMYHKLCEITLREITENERVITLIDLLFHTYDVINEVRQNAIKNFNALLKMRLNYDTFKYDVSIDNCEKDGKMKDENKSLLVKSLFTDIEYYDNAFWEHTIHLVYLTAYGTVRQWRDMWEEFMLIKPYFVKIIKDEKNKPIRPNAKAECVIKGIEGYIIGLQRNS